MENTTTSASRKPRTPWTPQDEATLRDLTGEGRTDAQIAAHMARDVKLIGKKRRALGIDRGVPAGLSAMLARLGASEPGREGLMVKAPANRTASGRKPGTFAPGQSGNPSGRPKDVGPIKELAKQHTEAAINALVGALGDENGRTRVAAAEAILDRAYGKPTQHHELDAGDELVRRMAEAAKRLKDGAG